MFGRKQEKPIDPYRDGSRRPEGMPAYKIHITGDVIHGYDAFVYRAWFNTVRWEWTTTFVHPDRTDAMPRDTSKFRDLDTAQDYAREKVAEMQEADRTRVDISISV